MSNKLQLKPLTHKKPTNVSLGNSSPLTKPPLKQPIKQELKRQQIAKPVPKKPTTQIKPATKVERTGQRTSKTIQLYDCDDFELELEDNNNYFQSQIQKNIKTQVMSKTAKNQPKTNIILPKLQADTKVRGLKELEKQMDEEMSKMHYEYGNAYE